MAYWGGARSTVENESRLYISVFEFIFWGESFITFLNRRVQGGFRFVFALPVDKHNKVS